MKHISYFITLILWFVFCQNGLGQSKTNTLTIGDTVPNFSVKIISKTGQVTERSLLDFKGKSILIDFWGTWCAPCVGSIPKIDSLQKEFADNLVILPVTDESQRVVNAFFQNIIKAGKPRITTVINDSLLNHLFPHRTVPTYVWIGSNGIVKAISYSEEVNRINIKRLITGQPLNLTLKTEAQIPVNTVKVASLHEAIEQISGDSSVIFSHMLGKFTPGFGGKANARTPGLIICQNFGLVNLFAIAYGNGGMNFLGGLSHIRLLTSDSARFLVNWGPGKLNHQYRENWRLIDGHLYNYILKIPVNKNAEKFEIMRQDLHEFFPEISAQIVKEKRSCYVLAKLPGREIEPSKVEGKFSVERSPFFIKINNSPLENLVLCIKLAYQESTDLQIVDETNYTGKIDVEVYGKITDPAILNNALTKYGLQFTKEERTVELLEIRDLKNPPKSAKL